MRQRHKPAPLTVQVTQAERRVVYRRRLVHYHASRLGQKLRQSVSSPIMLFVAGGLGFAAERLTRRPASTPGNTERASHSRLFAAARQFISLATTLLRRLAPVAARLETGMPTQSEEARFRQTGASSGPPS